MSQNLLDPHKIHEGGIVLAFYHFLMYGFFLAERVQICVSFR